MSDSLPEPVQAISNPDIVDNCHDRVASDRETIGDPWVLLNDGPLLAVNKPAGILTLGALPDIPTLERQVKNYLKIQYSKQGNVYLGIPHRLDRPVSGVVVFSKNSKCAARLAEQFRDRIVKKVYWAWIEGDSVPDAGEFEDYLVKDEGQANVRIATSDTPGAKRARLRFRKLSINKIVETDSHFQSTGQAIESDLRSRLENLLKVDSRALVEVELETGRMHQIRVQFGSRGWPILGDSQYGSRHICRPPNTNDHRCVEIALHARQLALKHPIRYDDVRIVAPLPASWTTEMGVPIPESMDRISQPEPEENDSAHD